MFGDGSAMKVEDLDLLLRLAEEGAVKVEWQKGDLVILDVSSSFLPQQTRKYPWMAQQD